MLDRCCLCACLTKASASPVRLSLLIDVAQAVVHVRRWVGGQTGVKIETSMLHRHWSCTCFTQASLSSVHKSRLIGVAQAVLPLGKWVGGRMFLVIVPGASGHV
jgi:hypothetical protein